MNAPKEIYLRCGRHDSSKVDMFWYDEQDYPDSPKVEVKYIRADIAELTWETCHDIVKAFFAYMNDIASGKASSLQNDEELYKEVLRRFNENKK